MELKTVLPLVTLLVVTTLHEVTGFDLGESEFCERIKNREERRGVARNKYKKEGQIPQDQHKKLSQIK